jgi:hypothetical protein
MGVTHVLNLVTAVYLVGFVLRDTKQFAHEISGPIKS